jgi:hypothetical protein
VSCAWTDSQHSVNHIGNKTNRETSDIEMVPGYFLANDRRMKTDILSILKPMTNEEKAALCSGTSP